MVRAVKRSKSPIIESKLSCKCGSIQGKISAKKEDSLRIYCYCTDCRAYATAIGGLGGDSSKPSFLHANGECHLVQVCKDAVTIDKGKEKMKLARKAPNQGMYRYYAECCNVPLMNTVDILGFVGVYDDNLDENVEQFFGPFDYCTHEASKLPIESPNPKNSILRFLWNLLRYASASKAGPFDYSLTPFYWGDNKDEKEKSN